MIQIVYLPTIQKCGPDPNSCWRGSRKRSLRRSISLKKPVVNNTSEKLGQPGCWNYQQQGQQVDPGHGHWGGQDFGVQSFQSNFSG